MAAIILKDKIYIPCKLVDEDVAREKYTFRFYDEAVCRQCVFRRERHCQDCETCEFGGFKDSVCTMNYTTIKGKPYYGFPMGDIDNIERRLGIYFDDYKVIDKTCKEKFSSDFKPEMKIEMYDYQKPVIKTLAKVKMGGLQSKPRTGKCVDGKSKVNTEFGYLNIKRLWDLFGKEGQETVPIDMKITTRNGVEQASFLHRKRSKTIGISTSANHRLRGTPEHPVLVVTPNLKFKWRRLDEVSVGDWVVMVRGEEFLSKTPHRLMQIKMDINNATKVKQPKAMSPELAYIMGCLVANGSLTDSHRFGCIPMSTNNEVIGKKYSAYVKTLFGVDVKSATRKNGTGHLVTNYTIGSVYVRDFLAKNDLSFVASNKKHIPESVLRSDGACVRAFLSGYISSDSETMTQDSSELILCTASPRLHNDLKSLLLSFGVFARSLVKYKAATNGTGIKRKYGSLCITSDNRARLLDLIDLDKECLPIDAPKTRSDSDKIPFLADIVKSFDSDLRKFMFGGRHQTKAKSGHMSRSTFERIDWRQCPESVRKFVKHVPHYFFQQVEKVKHFDKETYVYDLTVEGSHSFLANGFVVHNTTMAVALMIKLGFKVVVLANQKDYLDGFAREISENTNIPELEEKLGRKLYGFPKKDKDWKEFEILLVTYQSLIQDSDTHRNRIKWLRQHRGMLVVDEVHKGNASSFAKILTQMTARVRIGLSATFDRKDKRDILIRYILGPVAAKTDAKGMTPKMILHVAPALNTKAKFTGQAGWSRLTKAIANFKERNEYILSWVLKDLEKGRSIAIPTYHVEHAKWLVREINYRYGDEIAATFLGGTKEAKKREQTIIKARAGEIRCVVGIRMLIQTGINIAQWDCFVGNTLIPTSQGLYKIEDLCPRQGVVRSSIPVHNGHSYVPTALAGHMGKKIVREVTTNSGFQLTGSLNQKVLTLRSDMSLRMSTLSDLKVGTNVILSSAGNSLNDCLTLPFGDSNIKLDEDLAYLMGALRGDGSVMSTDTGKWRCDFYNQDVGIYNKVKRIGISKFGKGCLWEVTVRNSMNELRFHRDVFDFFKDVGLHGRQPQREVPYCILQSPKSVQAAYLSGELDTDGYLSNAASRYTIGFASTSKKAMEQIQALAFHSFGIVLKYNPLKTLNLTGNVRVLRGSEIKQRHVCYNLSIVGKEANALMDILKCSVKLEKFARRLKFKDNRVTNTRHIPGLAQFLKTLKKANGVYHDYVTGDRVDLQLQKWSVNPSIDMLIADNAVSRISQVYPDAGKKLAKLLKYASAFETVRFLQDSDEAVDTYDFSMADTKHPIFNAGGFVAHNCLYNIQPMNNAPNWEQESNRICTPLAGKKTPIIRFFIDTNLTTAFSCVRSTIGQSLTLGHTITDHSRNKAESLGIDLKSVKDDSTRKFESGLGRNL